MKLFVVVLIYLASAVCGEDAPYPPSGWKPQGALLVLPRESAGYEYGPPAPPNETTTQPPQDQPDLEKANESIMERLKQEEGSDRGVYYVYLPDGRLQRVQYTSAPIKKAPVNTVQQSSFQNTQQSNHQVVFGSHQTNTQGNSQFIKYQNQYEPQYLPSESFQSQNYASVETPEQKETPAGDPSQIFAKFYAVHQAQKESSRLENEAPASYVASIQYTDVAPISGPIYSYNQAPLTRVVRYAPGFQ